MDLRLLLVSRACLQPGGRADCSVGGSKTSWNPLGISASGGHLIDPWWHSDVVLSNSFLGEPYRQGILGNVVSSLIQLMVGEDSGGKVVSSILDMLILSWLGSIPMEMTSKHLGLSRRLHCASKLLQDSSSNLAWGERVECSGRWRTYELKIIARSEGRLKKQSDSPKKAYNFRQLLGTARWNGQILQGR